MDDEKKWNLNAPQNDTENNRQNEPPRYEHYASEYRIRYSEGIT